nr:hypothetical protein [Tanacetum cinerariifolium]
MDQDSTYMVAASKVPMLKPCKYELWMRMEQYIQMIDYSLWDVIDNGNAPPITQVVKGVETTIALTTAKEKVQRRYVVPTGRVIVPTGRDIWNAARAKFGGNAESKKMRKSMLKQEFSKFRIEDEDINLKFLRALPSSWSQVALTLKTKCGLELLSFDDLYYKLKTLEVDVKGYTTFSSSQSAGLSHSAFVSTTSASKKMSYGESLSYSSTTTYSAPSNSKTGKLDLEEMDLKWQMAMLFVRVHKFKQKAERKIDFDKKESARFNKKKVRCYKCQQRDHDSESDGVITAKEFGMIAGCDSEDAIKEGAAKIYNLITGADTEEADTAYDTREFALMGATSERNSSKNLFRLINSSMSVRTKVGLGFNNYIRENELGWDDSAFSVFTTNSEDVEGRPLFNRFAKADSIKVMPPPLSGDYTSLSNHIDLDEPQMSYGIKSSISCDDSDKSSEVNTNDFASSDSSFKLITLSFHHHKSHQDIRKSKEENRWRRRT